MKNTVFLAFFAIFFLAAFNLAAYDPISRDSNVYILPVAGAGGKAVKAFIYDRMNYETAYQNYLLLWARRGSDYIVKSRISRAEEDKEAFVLNLSFMLGKTNKLLSARQLVFYETSEELGGKIAEIMTDFFMGRWDIEDELIFAQRELEPEPEPEETVVVAQAKPEPEPEEEEEPVKRNFFFKESRKYMFSDDWRDKLFYFEYAYLWAPRKEFLRNDEINYVNLGLSFALEMQFVSFMSLEMGVQFIQEISGGKEYRDFLVEVPVAVKFVLKPFNRIMIEPYGGIAVNYVSLMNKVTPSYITYFYGLELIFNTRSGSLVFEPRLTTDIDESLFGTIPYKRKMMPQLGIGYKTGFFSKLVKR